MKQLFWINIFFLFLLSAFSQEIAQVVNASSDDAKSSQQRSSVSVAIKVTMDSFGLDWNVYGVKAHEGIEVKFGKSMLDWLTVSKVPTIDQLFLLDDPGQESVPDYTHVIHWNLSLRKTNAQGKIQQFQLSADYFIADKKNPDSPFYKGTVPSEIRTFPADLIKQIPDVLTKSLSTMSTPHWQKIRQTLLAMQPTQDSFYVLVKGHKNINHVLNLADFWKEQSKGSIVDIKIDRFDQSEAKLKVWYKSIKSQKPSKLLSTSIPEKSEMLPFKIKEDKSDDDEMPIFLIN